MEDFMGMAIGFGMLVGVPITWLLLTHQRKMAELIHRTHEDRKGDSLHRVQALEDEVRQLRATVHELIVRHDDLQSLDRPAAPPSRLADEDNEKHHLRY